MADKKKSDDDTKAKKCHDCNSELQDKIVKRCGQCRKVRYCNVDCQSLHWSTHKRVCRSSETDEFFNLLQHKRGGLLEFLGRNGHGKRASLMNLFRQLEVTTEDPLALRRWSMHPSKIDSVYEWPTDELCHCIYTILKYEQCDRIHEVAAGAGLLSARFNQYVQSLSMMKKAPVTSPLASASVAASSPPISASPSNVLDPVFVFTPNLFMPVQTLAVGDLKEKGTPMLVAWADPSMLSSFHETILRNRPKFVLAIGEPFPVHGRQSISQDYKEGRFPYSSTHITVRQLCHKDRTLGNDVASGEDSRSIINYYRLEKPALTREQSAEVCGASNLGTCASMDDDVHTRLVQQDLSLNLKHDPQRRFSCQNPLCPGCPYE